MLDQKFVRDHMDEIKETIARQKHEKELEPILEHFLSADADWKRDRYIVDQLRAQRNTISESINKAKKAGEDVSKVIAEAKEIPKKIKTAEESMQKTEVIIRNLLRKIPNIMHADVPYGKDDSENVEVRKWGEPKQAKVKNHVELCEERGWADFDASARTSGNGFYFLKGDLALLNQALIRYAITKLTGKGYEYVEPPLVVRKQVLDAAMDAEGFEQTIYKVVDDSDGADGELAPCLIGTAEHPILGLHEGTTFTAEELPKKYAGYSMCFRQEIGSHGINEKGLWRTHQFNKVEQFIFCLPKQSWKLYDELMKNTEELMQELELPYRIIEICTGDLALWKSRSHDVEVWRPTTNEYGEVASLSNCTIYQATDLNIRYVRRDGERGTVHTLNNTALATSRIMVAILENNQNPDGTVNIPKVLQPLMGKKKLE